jgi:hypothetical protein
VSRGGSRVDDRQLEPGAVLPDLDVHRVLLQPWWSQRVIDHDFPDAGEIPAGITSPSNCQWISDDSNIIKRRCSMARSTVSASSGYQAG